jgi:D-3-phosphoglycerate dehydrogenase
MPKIVISTSSFDVAASGALRSLASAGYEIVTNPHKRRLTEAEAIELLRDREVVGMIAGTEPLSRAALEKAGALKVISRCGIGMDNVDLGAAQALGIDVLNTPDAPTESVAELTLGLILAALRRIGEADRGIRAGLWRPLMGGLLRARTLGIVGYGRIGRRVATLADAFGARILACDVREFAPPPRVERTGLDALLAASDIVTLHMSSMPQKEAVFTKERLSRMKPGAILVNTSRGDLVDEHALAQALESGRLAGAALDTFSEEPYSGPLAALAQVTLTAHMGSYAQEARAAMEEEAARNLVRALDARGLVGAAPAG